jgi:hypothetical protein
VINFRVQWPNANHVLLSRPTIDVKVDGAALSALVQLPGLHDFQIPDGAGTVELFVSFEATLNVNLLSEPLPFTLLEAGQHYRVEQDALIAERAVIVNPEGIDFTRVVHPLIQTVSAANALSGVAVAEVRTEFIDITDHWLTNAEASEVGLRALDAERASAFVAIAATGSQPPLWFAHFPKGVDSGSPLMSVLTFFRPHGHYTYATAFDRRHASRGLQDLNRYLLAPQGREQVDVGRGGLETFEQRFPFADTYYPLRIGWQRAVITSGKQMVVLHPWPTSGLQFGDALTAKLPVLIDQILAFLHGTGRIAASQPKVQVGRMGLSGYSAGGAPAVQALKANRSRVKELYLFDPFPFLPDMPFVIDWAFKTPNFRLRMTGANFWGLCETVRRTIVAGLTGEAGDAFVTLRPVSLSVFQPEDKGGGHYWNYVIHTQKELQFAPHVQHQFAAFGGDQLESDDEFNLLSNTTWLEEFLTESAF